MHVSSTPRHPALRFFPVAALAVFLATAAPGCMPLCAVGLGDCQPGVAIALEGAGDMNQGNAASVVVYQLSSDVNFRRTPIETFWKDDTGALGDELVGPRREVLLYPAETRLLEVALQEPVNYVGVAANLRAPAPDAWRRIYPVDTIRGTRLAVRVGRQDLTIQIR
jgi:type VI secretion system VasD/TssJ family lipoprotein